MNKSYFYTALTGLLALTVVFGSMQGMRLILQIRERQLLTERGKEEWEILVRAWEDREQDETDREGTDGGESVLDWEQVVEAVAAWTPETVIMLHTPVEGQISMEQAIRTGEEWLARMGGQEKGEARAEMNASLGVPRDIVPDKGQLEPYYSFWIVDYSGSSAWTTLHINAVTGKVWEARITTVKHQREEIPYENLGKFAELTGLKISDNSIILNVEGTEALWELEDGRIYAHMRCERSYGSATGEIYEQILYYLTPGSLSSESAAGNNVLQK